MDPQHQDSPQGKDEEEREQNWALEHFQQMQAVVTTAAREKIQNEH